MRHKLAAYILKNPPPKPKKKEKQEKQEVQSEQEDDEITRRINKEAAHLRSSSMLEDDWAEDTTPEAVANRMKELAADQIENLIDRKDELDEFAEYVTSQPTPSDQEIYDKAIDLDISLHKAIAVLPQILFDESLSPATIKKYAPLLMKFAVDEKCQKALLGGIERTVAHVYPSLLPKTPAILKYVYDQDIVDESVFIKWGDRPSKKYVEKEKSKLVREKAAPFLNWLKEAEEEEDSDEDEE
jgi:translation initiation factor 5